MLGKLGPQSFKLKRWWRRLLILMASLAMLFVLGHLTIRFWLWPQVETSKPAIERLIGARLGSEVEIDQLTVAWVGLRPSFQIQGFRFVHPNKNKVPNLAPLLEIKNISGELSWLTLYHLKPYFAQLEFDDARIQMRRDQKGNIAIAGINLKNDPGDFSAVNWLLNQDQIRIKNAQIMWQDLARNPTPIAIQLDRFELTNGIRRHYGELSLQSPWHKQPLQLQANFIHHLASEAGNWRNWDGEFSWVLSGLNLAQLSQDFKLPIYSVAGLLNSNGKLVLDGGKPKSSAIQFNGEQIQLQTTKEKEGLGFGHIEFNLTQTRAGKMILLTTKNLVWRDLQSAANSPLKKMESMTFKWRAPEINSEIKEFGFSAPSIQIANLTLFVKNLPLPKKLKQLITNARASGELQNIDLSWAETKSSLPLPTSWLSEAQLDLNLSVKLVDVSFTTPFKALPSVAHLTGTLLTTEKAGSLTLDAQHLALQINDFLSDPKLQFDQASGILEWKKTKNNWEISGKKVQVENKDVSSHFSATYLLKDSKEADFLTLDMNLARAEMPQIHRYLPIAMNTETKNFLAKAFTSGEVKNGVIHIKGAPTEIPFAKPQTGEFSVNLPVVNATLIPDPLLPTSQGRWPSFSAVNGLVTIQQSKLDITIEQAKYKEVSLQQFSAGSANMSAAKPILQIKGDAQGDLAQMFEYLQPTPVLFNHDQVSKNLKVSGPALLKLDLQIPFDANQDPIINAELGLSKNRAQWDQFPPLENIRGTLRLRDEKAEFEDVHADLMGGTMQIISTVDSANKKLFTINGNANSNAIKSYFANAKLAANPFLMALGGKLNYKGSIAASSLAANLNLNFDLQNLSFDVPAPLKKESGTALQAEITIQSTPGSKTKPHTVDWSGRIGDLISAQGNLIDGEASRQSIGVGVIAPKPTSDTNISMQLAELNADSWQTFLNSGPSKEGTSSNAIGLTDVAIGQFNAQIKNFIFLNRTWPDLNINASGKNNGLLARINSPALAGQVDLQLNSASGKPNKVSGKLSYLHVPQANSPKLPLNSEMSVVNPVSRPVSSQKTIRLLPDIDLTINDFTWAKGQLGVTTLKASNQGDRFQIDSLTVNNPEAKVSITGKWLEYAQVGNEQTSLDVEADISNLGVIISRWGNPNQIEGGVGKLTAKLDWQGSPFQPEWSSIAGQVNIDLSNGRLLEVDTGAVQLLNVLSLQSLLKFASFNEASTVRDLANKGTAFNSIISTFNIRNGVARTNQFNMELNQARVFMSGLISIPNQTQDLRVTIFPTLDATTGALALVAINPIAGLAALVGQYLLTNRINKAMESDYLIQGSWQTPQIIPLNQQGQPLDPSVMDSIRKRDLLRQQQEPAAAPLPRVSTSAQ